MHNPRRRFDKQIKTIAGIIRGANYLDDMLYGLARAAGNCPLELLISFLIIKSSLARETF